MTSRTNRRATIAAGLTAGLIGGAAAGAAIGVTGSTGASSGGAAVVSEDEPDVPAGDAVTAADAPSRLREELQPLVDEGVIDSGQADAVAEHLHERAAERAGEHGPRGGPGHPGGRLFGSETVTGVLGLDADQIRERVRDGASLADIAGEQGVDPEVLVTALVAEATERLDEAVADGRLDAERAAERVEELQERIADLVNGERPAGVPGD